MQGSKWLILALVLTAGGCNNGLPFRGNSATGGGASGTPMGDWPFTPFAMRIHPFTSLTTDEASGEQVLDARIELLDPVGDVTKGVGDLRFELYSQPPTASREGERQRLQQWHATIAEISDNRRHYDAITRTYSFRLKVTAKLPRKVHLTLKAQFTDPTGRRLHAEAPLSYAR